MSGKFFKFSGIVPPKPKPAPEITDARLGTLSRDPILDRKSIGSKSAREHVEGFCMWMSAQLQTRDVVHIPYVGTIRRTGETEFSFFPNYLILKKTVDPHAAEAALSDEQASGGSPTNTPS